jgi:hypothetical protein
LIVMPVGRIAPAIAARRRVSGSGGLSTNANIGWIDEGEA